MLSAFFSIRTLAFDYRRRNRCGGLPDRAPIRGAAMVISSFLKKAGLIVLHSLLTERRRPNLRSAPAQKGKFGGAKPI